MEMESKTQFGDPANFAVKRRRSPSPPISAASTTTTAAGSSSSYGSTEGEDDQDMANCLILLAQGHHGGGGAENRRKRVVVGEDSAGFFVYDCKTCNRSFPSFQALGGHRASHKKPKPNSGPTESEDKEVISPPSPLSPPTSVTPSVTVKQITQPNTLQQLAVKSGPGGKFGKVHECAICGAEFNSGQALGGHMRRHRASNGSGLTTTTTEGDQKKRNNILTLDQKKRNNVLTLDLNMPAQEDLDNRQGDQSKFRFTSLMVFSSPTLMGCHY